jgi:tRNA (uracil-5-)-methyltransferase TRM9
MINMDLDTIRRLLDLNQEFYQTFALQFSTTRQRLQPGVLRILESLQPTDRPSLRSGLSLRSRVPLRLLDLGCGNGELARQLAGRGYQGEYVGLDASPQLLQMASDSVSGRSGFTFLKRDLADPNWDLHLPFSSYDRILAFAVLHHLPGDLLRRSVLEKVRALLPTEGQFIHSEWQILDSPRLRSRLQPWHRAGLSEVQVGKGDYLIDWRLGGTGLRYVHVFSQEELEQLALETGFEVVETFLSDGEGGRLGLYQIWKVV